MIAVHVKPVRRMRRQSHRSGFTVRSPFRSSAAAGHLWASFHARRCKRSSTRLMHRPGWDSGIRFLGARCTTRGLVSQRSSALQSLMSSWTAAPAFTFAARGVRIGPYPSGLPLAAQIRRWMTRIDASPGKPLFPAANGGSLTRSAITDRLKRATKTQLQSVPACRPQGLTPHGSTRDCDAPAPVWRGLHAHRTLARCSVLPRRIRFLNHRVVVVPRYGERSQTGYFGPPADYARDRLSDEAGIVPSQSDLQVVYKGHLLPLPAGWQGYESERFERLRPAAGVRSIPRQPGHKGR
jgi:hypothetical protein